MAEKFAYNGIEQEQALGLNLYEMSFRSYDPAIARFNGIDPVTHYSMGTSIAFDNNPVFWADPSGANAVTTSENPFFDTNAGGTASVFNTSGSARQRNESERALQQQLTASENGPGDPPKVYNGPSVATGDNVVNQLDEVIVVGYIDDGFEEVGDDIGSSGLISAISDWLDRVSSGDWVFGSGDQDRGKKKGKDGRVYGSQDFNEFQSAPGTFKKDPGNFVESFRNGFKNTKKGIELIERTNDQIIKPLTEPQDNAVEVYRNGTGRVYKNKWTPLQKARNDSTTIMNSKNPPDSAKIFTRRRN